MGELEGRTDVDRREGHRAAKGTGRRAVLKGAAWSIPVIAGVVAVPSASASGGLLAPLTGGDWTSQYPGGGQFDVHAPVSTGGCSSIQVTVVDYTITMKNGQSLTASTSMVNADMYFTRSSRPGEGRITLGGQMPAVPLAEFEQLVVILNVSENCGGPTGNITLRWSAFRNDQDQPGQSDGIWTAIA
ncbi:hypothetical protein J2Y69_002550 [Microbacterium resistens]|uniref:Uncharacterized protein n=1 Tax=Microbacterium resistens TaxID=156977 RepID=A0ABU1SEA1_9MICO|nr:hypothetical protein [Microbacterium resistens]MDR6867942.1 hypothetical protein [Microbacterium resistens]